jgi:tetratricopeptide (TPR) repeat protein
VAGLAEGNANLPAKRERYKTIMEFRVLGPIELWSGGKRHDLGPTRARCVLAVLLLSPGTTVSAEALIDRLWDTEPPPKARESLYVYVARLRASLRHAVGDDVQLVARARGYVLEVDPQEVDLHQFRRLRKEAIALAESGDYDHALALLRGADALWRGQALAGIRGDWIGRIRHSLEEERRAATLERVGCELELGRHADLIGELHHLLTQYPLDETLVAHQMIALYRSGRGADALSLFRETRDRLVDEQGTEPGRVLSELHQRILTADPELTIEAPVQLPVEAVPSATLPPETMEFTARQQESVPLTSAMSSEVTDAFDLSYQALESGIQRFFRRLGVSPCTHFSVSAAAALADCSLAEAEEAVATLLDCHLVSRVDDAQYRFHDLIRGYAAVRATNDDSEAEQRQAVNRLLDYYIYMADWADQVLHSFRSRTPLRIPQLPDPSPVLDSPEEAAGWLEAEWRNILDAARYAGRHEWKQKCADLINLLADFMDVRAHWDEAISAHSLALHVCRELVDPPRIARASLALSAARQRSGQHEAALPLAEDAAAIYRSLDDRRGEAGSLDQIGLAYQCTARSREALAYFQEAQILYHAMADQRGEADTRSHAGIACWHLGRYREALAHISSALALYREVGDPRGEAKALNNLGRIHLYNGYHREALDAYEESMQIFRKIGGAQNEAILHQNIGNVHHYKGSYTEALTAYQRALAIYCDIGDLPDQASVLNDIGVIYQGADCYDEALRHHQQAQRIAEEIKNLSQQLIALRGIADIERVSGRYGEAIDHYRAALTVAREIGDPYEEGKILEGVAESRLQTKREPEAARVVFRQALDIFERLGVPEAESVQIRIETIDPAFALRIS